jgi:alpha-L-fucosidase
MLTSINIPNSRIHRLLFFSFTLLLLTNAAAQTPGDEDKEMFNKGKERDQKAIDEAINGWWTASQKTRDKRVQWWRDAKFGMFIHWGIYSLPGGEWKGNKVSGYAEHLMRKEKITRNEYIGLAHKFNPVKFNAEEWILTAKKAGMKYFIITAKHHDGFALYNSKVSDFDIIDQTPFKRDPMDELAKAARKHGIKFGFYYSHAFDWEHPDAPGNDWEYKNPGGDLNLFGGRDWFDVHPELLPRAVKYVDEKAIPQIKELLTNYHPDILWFDTPHKLPLSENIRILKAIRETDPNVIVNGRLVRSANANFGDYKNTADRPAEFYPVTGDWEAIPTTNESYGYHRFDNSHKPVSHFIQLLANAASRGGNLLMNIGPKGDGSFDEKDLQILNGIGAWINKNKESVYEVTASSLPMQSWGVSTMKGNRLYLHVFIWPADGKLYIGGLKNNVTKVFSLADPKKQFAASRIDANALLVMLPKKPIDPANTVLVIDLPDKLQTDSVRYVATNVPVTRLLAFDAIQEGKGFSFGDGKTDRYYVEGWKSKDQVLSWDLRTTSPADFKVVIKYLAPTETSGGLFLLTPGDYQLKDTVTTGSGVITRELGTVTLGTGIFSMKMIPLAITKTELMKLLEIQLIPLNLGKRTE